MFIENIKFNAKYCLALSFGVFMAQIIYWFFIYLFILREITANLVINQIDR